MSEFQWRIEGERGSVDVRDLYLLVLVLAHVISGGGNDHVVTNAPVDWRHLKDDLGCPNVSCLSEQRPCYWYWSTCNGDNKLC